MKNFQPFIVESKISYNAWVRPSAKALKQEYDIEYQKHMKGQFGDIFPKLSDWISAIGDGQIVAVDSALDRKIDNRSRTGSKKELIGLIKSYRSYPQFRNETTIDNMEKRFKENQPMDMPLVYAVPRGRLWVVSGNTRMDMAFMLGIMPRVIVFRTRDRE